MWEVSRSTGDRQGCRKLEQCRSNCRDGRKRPPSAPIIQQVMAVVVAHRVCVANELPTLRLPLGHRCITHTTRYTDLAAGRFNGFWKD